MQFTNATIHKNILRATLPILLRDRFIADAEKRVKNTLCFSFDCENSDDMKRVPSLLELLELNDITTSFAIRGDLLPKGKGLVKQMLEHGHEIINHTNSHPHKFRNIAPELMKNEIISFQKLMKQNFNYTPEGFRAPHLMRKYNANLFRILRQNALYDSSYVGEGISVIDGVTEIPLTSCPDHPCVCFDYWHHFQLPLIRSSLAEFLKLWKILFADGDLVNIFLDPRLASDTLLDEMLKHVPRSYTFLQLRNIAAISAQVSPNSVKG